MICTIRIPDVLQARIDAAAGDEGRSKWILDACRTRLDAPIREAYEALGMAKVSGDGGSRRSTQVSSDQLHAISPDMQVSNPAPPTKPDEQALRDICAGKTSNDLYQETSNIEEIPICGKIIWEDGEQFECLMDAGHPEAKLGKHGLRGMVKRVDA